MLGPVLVQVQGPELHFDSWEIPWEFRLDSRWILRWDSKRDFHWELWWESQ